MSDQTQSFAVKNLSVTGNRFAATNKTDAHGPPVAGGTSSVEERASGRPRLWSVRVPGRGSPPTKGDPA